MLMSNNQLRRKTMSVLSFALIAIILFFVVFPLFWIVSTSLKTPVETFRVPPTIIPQEPTIVNYIYLWTLRNFDVYFKNSLIIAVSTTLLCLIIANLAAYGFSRYKMKGGSSLLMVLLVSQMIPSVLFVIPYFIVMGRMGLINSKIAIIIAHTSFSLPFCIWMMKGYYDSIPKYLDEAGKIDGCSPFRVMTQIVFPLTLPGNVATLVFAFLLSWNEYLFSLSLTTRETMYTVPVGIAMFMGEYQTSWNELMAAAVLASLPIIIIYLLVDKYMVVGLAAGAGR